MRNQPDSEQHLLLAYVADLELEVDRLRKLMHFLQHETRQTVKQMQNVPHALSSDESRPSLVAMEQVLGDFATLLQDVYEPTGYHPAHDQVVAIALRPLIEQVFRWQQRLQAAPDAKLHLELACEHVDWFPARLRHILDNLISNRCATATRQKGKPAFRWGYRACSMATSCESPTTAWACPGTNAPKRSSCSIGRDRLAPPDWASASPSSSSCSSKVAASLPVESETGQGTSFVAVLPYFTATDYLN